MQEFFQNMLKLARENELREPIPHIGHCTHHEPRSSIFKRTDFRSRDRIFSTLKTQRFKMAESVGEDLRLTTMIWC